MTVRITKEFHFEAAHALHNYDGKCKYLHGHSYKLSVTVKGTPITDVTNPKLGMVMDFGVLKQIINKLIINRFDHAVVFNKYADNLDILQKSNEIFDNKILTPYQPTCENMVIDFAGGIKQNLPEGVQLVSVKLYETENSYAEWFAEDNN
jgi:6-pyruvoyltetrahydropterin/6-carboxytetrahydropterin synthase